MATGTDVEPMDEEHRNILRRCKGTLVEDMEPEEVLLHLVEPLLFTTEDENKIKSRATRQQQCETLLDMLQRKGARAYEIFKKTIEIVHPHLANVEAENKKLRSELRIERENSADLRRTLADSKVKRGTPTDEELEMLGRDIADIWIKLGRRLDVSDAKLTEIDNTRKLLSEKAYHTLKHWKQNKGAAADYHSLCNALQHELVERQDLVEKFCYIKVKRGTPTDEELEMLGRDIADIWIKLGRRLDVSDAKLTEIDNARELLSEKAYHTLKHWKQNKGADANYQALCNALQHELVERQDLVEKFCYSEGIDTGTRPLAKARLERSGQVQVQHLERSHSQTVDAVEELKTVEGKANCKDVENRLKEKQKELKDVQADYKDVENRLTKKQEELEAVEAKCKNVETRLKEKQEELKAVEAKCKDEENRLKAKREEFVAAEAASKEATNRLQKNQEEKNSVPRKKAVTLVEIAGIMEDLESGWEEVATALELGEANLRKIRKENKTNREKAHAVLTMWTDEEGDDATVERLVDTLEKIAKSSPVEKTLENTEASTGEQSNQLRERAAEQSERPSEREDGQSKQPSEPETSDDIFSLLAEVQELRNVATGLERQPKQHEGEPAKQPTKQEGEQSKQPSGRESGDDMFSLLAENKELIKIATERKKHEKEVETLKEIIKDIKQKNIQIQELIMKMKIWNASNTF